MIVPGESINGHNEKVGLVLKSNTPAHDKELLANAALAF